MALRKRNQRLLFVEQRGTELLDVGVARAAYFRLPLVSFAQLILIQITLNTVLHTKVKPISQ
jgi:hypothetical protein